jgi:hypothetical protein
VKKTFDGNANSVIITLATKHPKVVISAKEAVTQLSDGPMIGFVMPDVIRNPLSFGCVMILDAGSRPA